jgi:hypothetical protein
MSKTAATQVTFSQRVDIYHCNIYDQDIYAYH